VQVSLVLFMTALSGVVPLTVMQSRHLASIERRYPSDRTQYLHPAEGHWAGKLGAPAILSDEPRSEPPPIEDPYAAIIVDDGDTSYREYNRGWRDWWHYGWSQAYGSDFTLNYPDEVNDRAVWDFRKLRPGEYTLYATYPQFGFANRDARYEFYVNGDDAGHEKVDQRKTIKGIYDEGVLWKKLDKLKIKSSNSHLRVELSDLRARGYNVIDAVRLEPKPPKMYLHEIDNAADQDFMEVVVHADYPFEVD
jgi:hypothetical protein